LRDILLISSWANVIVSMAVGDVYAIPVAGGVDKGEEILGSLSLFKSRGGGTLERGEARCAGIGNGFAGLGG
jgi:hypothetical protein